MIGNGKSARSENTGFTIYNNEHDAGQPIYYHVALIKKLMCIMTDSEKHCNIYQYTKDYFVKQISHLA